MSHAVAVVVVYSIYPFTLVFKSFEIISCFYCFSSKSFFLEFTHLPFSYYIQYTIYILFTAHTY